MFQLLHCLQKLYKLNVEVPHLQATGIGRTVNSLRKRDGEVGATARKIVSKWMEIVENHSTSSEEEETPKRECNMQITLLGPK